MKAKGTVGALTCCNENSKTLNCKLPFGSEPPNPRPLRLSNRHSSWNANFWSIKPYFTSMQYITSKYHNRESLAVPYAAAYNLSVSNSTFNMIGALCGDNQILPNKVMKRKSSPFHICTNASDLILSFNR
jgi:hypothetical protein